MNKNRLISVNVSTLCILSFMLIFGPLLGVSQAQDLPPEVLRYADTILYNGQVLTMDRDQPPITVVEALAIREGRIMAVGDSDRILKMAGPNTLRVDLQGKGVIPGVVDTHSHPNNYALRHFSGRGHAGLYRVSGRAGHPLCNRPLGFERGHLSRFQERCRKRARRILDLHHQPAQPSSAGGNHPLRPG